MDAKEIREFYVRNISGEIDGSLDEHNLHNALLGEIAAQLAEMNERPTEEDLRTLRAELRNEIVKWKKLQEVRPLFGTFEEWFDNWEHD